MNTNLEIIKEQLAKEIKSILCNEEIKIEYRTVIKNNDVKLQSITICTKKQPVSPNIYIDDILEDLLENNSQEKIEKAAYDIIVTYADAMRSKGNDYNHKLTTEYLKSRLYTHSYIDIVNKEKNKQRLQNCPYIEYLDLAITYKICVDTLEEGNATVLINNEMLKNFEISKEELHKIALANSEKENIITKSMRQVILEITGFMDIGDNLPMYVIGNDTTLGVNMLYTYKGIKELADKLESDLIILPSSIHEIIAIEYDDCLTVTDLKEMVSSINIEKVPEDEVLSDSVYVYRRENDYIELAS